MTDTKALLDTLKHHVATGEPVDADFGELIAEDAPDLVAALFASSTDESVRGQWAKKIDFEKADALGKVAWVASESEAVEERIDEMLDSGEAGTVAETLARAGIAWDSDQIEALLDHDANRRAAALLLAVANPDQVAAWLEDCEVVEDALEVLRAAALDLSEELAESFRVWEEALEELDEDELEKARLDGLYAVLEPSDYARRVLAGDSGIGWLGDMPVVADFLQVHGPTQWLEVLGMLEAVEDPSLELAALLAVSAAAGAGFEAPDDEEAQQLLDLLAVEPGAKTEVWEPIATAQGLGFAIAVAPDDELALLCAQVAAHERLTLFDIHSAGIPGLPLSATAEQHLNLETSRALLDGIAEMDEMADATVVAVVRTMCDLRRLVMHDHERFAEHAEAWVEEFLDNSSAAIRLAVRQLLVPLDHEAARREAELLERTDAIEAALAFSANSIEEEALIAALEEHARLEGPLGLDCARRLAMNGSDDALAALARLWKTGSVFRVAFYRDCLVEAVSR
ncbi:hypothetical protein FIV42_10930 [Persicimonas caeni]|uniref:Uncharacterized protein n=1 Tax=Persicimonas caeni TaxID=2292766 RepID=A0A4Y6PSB2_PERCE|nr:hypothetical protein [Persicimonas caeni]QDG51234.1 hypothetical protein FIV42_10930 [Persicimonas caeni]QED32455.1 hypothetical protein FRD00_10925 [Persicimonas caeni]